MWLIFSQLCFARYGFCDKCSKATIESVQSAFVMIAVRLKYVGEVEQEPNLMIVAAARPHPQWLLGSTERLKRTQFRRKTTIPNEKNEPWTNQKSPPRLPPKLSSKKVRNTRGAPAVCLSLNRFVTASTPVRNSSQKCLRLRNQRLATSANASDRKTACSVMEVTARSKTNRRLAQRFFRTTRH